MAQINLLPWREQARQARKIRFSLYLAGLVFLTLMIIVVMHLYYNDLINNQKKRNNFLQTELSKEGVALVALNKKKQKQKAIIDELRFVTSLREKSYRAVNLLDGLARAVPEGISLTKLMRDEDKIVLMGKAQSDVQITLFMKNLTDSKVFKQPVLTEISSRTNKSGNETNFQLKVEQQGVMSK